MSRTIRTMPQYPRVPARPPFRRNPNIRAAMQEQGVFA